MVNTIINSLTALACAVFISTFINSWGLDFKYPLIRSPRRKTGILYIIPSSMAIIVFYVITGYLILFGLAIPLVPGTNISISSFDLSIAGLLMVGTIRFLTLSDSIASYRTLLTALVLAFGLTTFIGLQDTDAFSAAVEIATTDAFTQHKDVTKALILPIVAIVLFAIVELIWIAYINIKKQKKNSLTFIEAIQQSLSKEEVGYTRNQIHSAYKKTIDSIAKEEDIWDIRWVSSIGAERDFYEWLIECVAARKAVNSNAVDSYRDFWTLPSSNKQHHLGLAKTHIKTFGKFMINVHAKERIQLFTECLGFEPALITNLPKVRFLIINKRILITSWSAHSMRVAYGGKPDFRSTMYSISEDYSRIEKHVKLFDSLWDKYQMNVIRSMLTQVSSIKILLLDLINTRGGIWSLHELSTIFNIRHGEIDPRILKDELNELAEMDLISKHDEEKYQRNHNTYVWQNRWIRLNEIENQ